MKRPEIKNANQPAPGEEYVMECTLTVQEKNGNASRSVSFEGYATKEVVGKFLTMAASMAGCMPYIVGPHQEVEKWDEI